MQWVSSQPDSGPYEVLESLGKPLSSLLCLVLVISLVTLLSFAHRDFKT